MEFVTNSYICNLVKMKVTPFKFSILFITSLIALSFNHAQAQLNQNQTADTLQLNTITTAVPFLLISPDSRAGAMGDVGVATSSDVNSIHWNASKLAFSDKEMGVSISYVPWLRRLVPDINLSYLTGYKKIDDDFAVGATIRYFSLGEITFTNDRGDAIGQFKPNEFSVDIAGARKLSRSFSGGMVLRYVYSNLTGGINVQGTATKPGQAFAVDVSGYYTNPDIRLGDKDGAFSAGINISNLGSKMSYSQNSLQRDFLPANLRLGQSTMIYLDDYNTISINTDINKLLVPTPPVYLLDSNSQPVKDVNGNFVVKEGKDPNVSVATGVFQSFGDAPGGFREELREINPSIGIEYWYDKKFAVRAGYFNEHRTKGNRKYVTMGLGLKLNVFAIDFSYLVSTTQNNPLENTVRFTLSFDFDDFKKQNNSSE